MEMISETIKPCTFSLSIYVEDSVKVHHYSSIVFTFSFICVQCGSHFNLSFGTVFLAVNYLDRFVSICQNNVRISGYYNV